MRHLRLVALAFAFAVIGCDLSSEVQTATDQLGLETGLEWTEEFVVSSAYSTGEIETDGTYKEDLSTFSYSRSETRGRRVHKVMASTHVAAFNKKGVLVQTVERVDEISTENSNDVKTQQPATTWIEDRVLVVDGGWIREIAADDEPDFMSSFSSNFLASGETVSGGDSDADRGRALYPANPKAGAYYTNDYGETYLAVETEPIVGREAMRLEHQGVEPEVPLEEFFSRCFFDDEVFGERQIELVEGCNDLVLSWWGPRFTVNARSHTWVSSNLALRTETGGEEIRIESICCALACVDIHMPQGFSNAYDFGFCDAGDRIYFQGSRSAVLMSVETTQVSKASDPSAPPTLEKAAQ